MICIRSGYLIRNYVYCNFLSHVQSAFAGFSLSVSLCLCLCPPIPLPPVLEMEPMALHMLHKHSHH